MLARFGWLLAGLAFLGGDERARNDPRNCTWCAGNPELMRASGVVSHGGFAFGEVDTARTDALLAACDIRWIETEHFEIGIALGPWKVKQEETKKIRTELERLKPALDKIDPKTRLLDPWLRAHLFAVRCEDVYGRMLQLLGVTQSAFPDGQTPWGPHLGKYMGEGPHLGQKGKYEVLLLPSKAAHGIYVKNQYGLTTEHTQRWNLIKLDTLALIVHPEQGSLREDFALHCHVAFNLAINLLDGFKHYSYDTPIWLREGIAHVVEREVSPKYNTFDSSEGAVAEMTSKEKWEPLARKLVTSGTAPTLAELVNMKEYADLTLPRHFACWSMVDYLLKTNPGGFARLNDSLHGRVSDQGFAQSSDLFDAHRDAFKEHVGMNYIEFDVAWRQWVLDTYAAQ